ncbi:hypothetical protein CEW92_11640 [Bacillaceae bacterium SAS-127]|nr:hypothetical protein CEW92_11640 [Bacillaceae bacterium SAS-127]
MQLRKDISAFSQEKFKENRTPFADSLKLHFYSFSEGTCHDDVTSCLEGLMLSLDMIDDIQDDDNERSLWKKKGLSTSLNTAISLMTISQLHLLESTDRPEIVKTMLTCLSKSIEGQHQDLYGNIKSPEQYIEMIKMKSGSLIAMANMLGAMLADFKDHQIVEDYSYDLGVVAQINNDIQDVIKFEEKSDWRLKKKTLPIMYLLNPSIKEGEIVRDYYSGKVSFETVLSYKEKIIDLLKTSGALNYTVAQKILYEQRALKKIERLPISDEKIKMIKDHLL